MTPEGRVKAKINHILNKHKVWSFMPVPTGFQSKTIDYLCCHKGWFIGIEAKAPGKEPTRLQNFTMRLIREAGGLTFVVSTDADIDMLDAVLGETNERAR